MTTSAKSGERYDVAIVGLGPVGHTLAILLAQLGHSVIAIDEQLAPYALPRAVHYDPDVSRTLDGIGLADFMAEFSSGTSSYEWQNANRATLLRFSFEAEGSQGWPESTMFTQPALEDRLRRRAGELDVLVELRGFSVTGFVQDRDGVEVSTVDPNGTPKTLLASYLIGCDGANSTVRALMEVDVIDLGFFSDWLICDLRPLTPREWTPDNLQLCDPHRPTSVVNSGPGRRRFEFMRMPHDDPATFGGAENCWRLLAEWDVAPDDAVLERSTVYTFQARWADSWRENRVMLAGDAAHLMPPFYGQGMVSGIRDAMNLAWKLDLVLAGTASAVLLDSYESERSAHVQHAIGMSVELGKVICQTDPAEVAARDAHFLATGPDPQNALPPVPPERLGFGIFPDGDPTRTPLAGTIGVNARVRFSDGAVHLLDRRTFGSFVVLCDGAVVTPDGAATLADRMPTGVSMAVVRILGAEHDPPQSADPRILNVADVTGRFLRQLGEHALSGIVVRPDFHIYGGAETPTRLAEMLEALGSSLEGDVGQKEQH